ncbi:MAG: sodium/solute symporter [Chlamydiales bacterium]|nr:sodium/proline symporter [Chlamydiales bacterium]NCF71361.1 sodium/solute symporter [Chlamydiales bacterium]
MLFTHAITALLLYFAIVSLIAYFSYHKQKNTEDFLMGGRSLNFYLTALSAHASDMSSWLFIGFPVAVYKFGLEESWAAAGLLIGMFLNWTLIAKPLRIATESRDNLSLPSYLENAFGDKSGIVRLVSSLALLFFFTVYIASGLQGIGILFESLFSIDYQYGIFTASILVILYTMMGGFVTVAWTDLFQALFLLAAIILTPLLAYLEFPELFDSTTFTLTGITPFKNSGSWVIALFLSLGWGLGYFGQPHILSKFMGIKDPNEIKKSRLVGVLWQFLALSAAVAVGIVGIAFFPEGLDNSERLFIEIVKVLFNPFIASFILCGVLAATLSTIDTMLLVSASSISEDFFDKYFPQKNEKKKLLTARLSLMVMGLVAFAIAHLRVSSVFELVAYSWSGLGCIFGPLVIASLYLSKISSKKAVLTSIIAFVVSIAWPYFQAMPGECLIASMNIKEAPTMVVGYILCFTCLLFPVKKAV